MDREGNPCSDADPSRLLWYGPCGYWTDDWNMLPNTGGIPCCPHCHMVGFQIEAGKWFAGALKYQEEQKKVGYFNFVVQNRETCFRGKWMEAYEKNRKPPEQSDSSVP